MSEPIKVKILNNEVALDQECWSCYEKPMPSIPKGSGFINDPIQNDVCGICDGSGYALTELGQAIIDLMKRHNKKETK